MQHRLSLYIARWRGQFSEGSCIMCSCVCVFRFRPTMPIAHQIMIRLVFFNGYTELYLFRIAVCKQCADKDCALFRPFCRLSTCMS